MSSRAEDLAYFAGFFDGEGWVSVSAKRKGNGQRWTSLQIGVAQKTRDVLEFAQRLFPSGRIYFHTLRPSPIYTLEWNSQKAAKVLREVLPFLKVKKAQALLYLEFAAWRAKRGKGRLSPGDWLYCQNVSKAMKALNAARPANGVNSGKARNSSAVGNPEPSPEIERQDYLWEGVEVSPDDILSSITDISAPRESDEMTRTYGKP